MGRSVDGRLRPRARAADDPAEVSEEVRAGDPARRAASAEGSGGPGHLVEWAAVGLAGHPAVGLTGHPAVGLAGHPAVGRAVGLARRVACREGGRRVDVPEAGPVGASTGRGRRDCRPARGCHQGWRCRMGNSRTGLQCLRQASARADRVAQRSDCVTHSLFDGSVGVNSTATGAVASGAVRHPRRRTERGDSNCRNDTPRPRVPKILPAWPPGGPARRRCERNRRAGRASRRTPTRRG